MTGAKLTGDTEKQRHALFAIKPDGRREPEGWTNLMLLLWKHVVFSLVQVSTEDAVFDKYKVWSVAWIRLEKKALALQERALQVLRRDEGRGNEPRDVSSRGAALDPIAKLSPDGQLIWDEKLVKKIKTLGKKPDDS